VLGRHDAVEDIDNIQLRHGGNLRPDRFFHNVTSLARLLASQSGRAGPLCPSRSDIDLFRYGKGIIHLDAEVPDGTLDFGVSERS
jgi:hypothetical protein